MRKLLPFAAVPLLIFCSLYRGLFWKIGHDPLLSFAMAGAFVVHLWRRPSRVELGVTAAVAVLLRLVYESLTRPGPAYFGHAVIGWGTYLGLASLAVLSWRALRTEGGLRRGLAGDLGVGAALFGFWILLDLGLAATAVFIPHTLDRYLYGFDGSLGFQLSFQLGRVIDGHSFATGLVQTVYVAIALPLALLYAWQRRCGYAGGYAIFPLVMAAAAGGYLVYYIFPATGPLFEFPGQFPWHIPQPILSPGDFVPLQQRFARNAMPSLHLGAVLLVCWNSRLCPRWGRVAAWLFLAMTAFSTLALGQHYLVDLVVAFPAMLIFHAAAMTSVPLHAPERWAPIGFGIVTTAGWLLLLRFGSALWTLPGISHFLVAGTLAGTCLLESRLAARAGLVHQANVYRLPEKARALVAG